MMRRKVLAQIPFSPFPTSFLLRWSRHFMGIGKMVSNAFPYLDLQLQQSEMDFRKEEYGAIMAMLFCFYFAVFFIIFFLLSTRLFPKTVLLSAAVGAGILALLVLIQLSVYPAIVVSRRVGDIERNLVFALRTMLVEVKSGVSLFDTLSVVAHGEYGAVSEAFSKAVERIQTGDLEEEALARTAMQNPSPFFRKTIWQMVNGMKAGADVSLVMEELVNSMGKEQRLQINRYGGSLRLLSLIYMMIGVIVPAMGITFLIVLSSFPQIRVTNELFWGLLGLVVLMQFMFLGFLKSKRPSIIG